MKRIIQVGVGRMGAEWTGRLASTGAAARSDEERRRVIVREMPGQP